MRESTYLVVKEAKEKEEQGEFKLTGDEVSEDPTIAWINRWREFAEK